jgi:hypothetical protein
VSFWLYVRYNLKPADVPKIYALVQATDAKLRDALHEYHRKRLTNNQEIANLLEREHNIKMRCVLILIQL